MSHTIRMFYKERQPNNQSNKLYVKMKAVIIRCVVLTRFHVSMNAAILKDLTDNSQPFTCTFCTKHSIQSMNHNNCRTETHFNDMHACTGSSV